MKILWTLVATVVCASASIQFCDAAQMVLKLEGDPESFFAAPDNPSLDQEIGSALTVEAWVNPAVTIEENGLEMMIVNKEDQYEAAIVSGAGGDDFQVAVFPAGNSWTYHDSEVAIPVNTWSHVAFTWDGTMVRLFVNGKFANAHEWAGPDGAKGVLNTDEGASGGKATLKVGRRGRGDAERHSIFNGLIDEMRISKSLRYTEAGYTVPGKAFVPDADTVALYHFDEVSTAAGDIQSLQARLVAAGRTDDNGDGELDPELGIRGVVKDASAKGNHGGFTGTKVSLVAVSNSPVTDTP
jgi:hypothetical protein